VPSSRFSLLFLAVIVGQLGLSGTSTVATASPAVEVVRAFQVASSTSKDPTSDKPFLRAWRAVISGANEFSVADYVSAAVRLRPRLAPAIVESSLSILIRRKQQRLTQRSLAIIRETVRAAILTEPKAAASIVAAALSVQPFAHGEIVAAGLLAAPREERAIAEAASQYSAPLNWIELQKVGHDYGYPALGALNPANIDVGVFGRDDKNVRSPEKGPE
jgi:hypothetical protein